MQRSLTFRFVQQKSCCLHAVNNGSLGIPQFMHLTALYALLSFFASRSACKHMGKLQLHDM